MNRIATIIAQCKRAWKWPSEKKLQVANAYLAVSFVSASLGRRPVPDIARALGVRLAGTDPSNSPPPSRADDFTTPLWTVDAVYRHWPGDASCLRRALVLGHLLRQHAPELHLGVRHADEGLEAHAWLTVNGTPLLLATENEAGGSGDYRPLSTLNR